MSLEGLYFLLRVIDGALSRGARYRGIFFIGYNSIVMGNSTWRTSSTFSFAFFTKLKVDFLGDF